MSSWTYEPPWRGSRGVRRRPSPRLSEESLRLIPRRHNPRKSVSDELDRVEERCVLPEPGRQHAERALKTGRFLRREQRPDGPQPLHAAHFPRKQRDLDDRYAAVTGP